MDQRKYDILLQIRLLTIFFCKSMSFNKFDFPVYEYNKLIMSK